MFSLHHPFSHILTLLYLLADLELLSPDRVKPQYETLPGWKTSISACKSYDGLPENAKKYIEFIEKQIGVPVEWIGVGPGRESMIYREI